MANNHYVFIFAFISVLLGGCATSTPIALNQQNTEVKIFTKKSYTLGVILDAWIGSPLVHNRSEERQITYNAIAKPSKTFYMEIVGCIAGERCKTLVPDGRYYEVEKAVVLNGDNYFVVNLSRSKLSRLDTTIYSPDGFRILVGKDGHILQELYMEGLGIMPNGMKTVPSDARMMLENIEKVTPNGYINDELLFAGFKDGYVNLKHVEYEPSPGSGKGRIQTDYRIKVEDGKFRFGRYLFEILEGKESSIKFKVLADQI